MLQNAFSPPDKRNPAVVAEAAAKLKAPLAVIEQQLGNREYLLGKEFTIADLDVASVWVIGSLVGFDLSSAPKTAAWLTKCTSRPANQRASQKN
jgi:glutathione S-transferase